MKFTKGKMYKDERKLESEGNKRQYRDQELASSLWPHALSFVSWLVQSVLVAVQHKLSYPTTFLLAVLSNVESRQKQSCLLNFEEMFLH